MSEELSGNQNNHCNCMDPLRDLRAKYTKSSRPIRALRKIGYCANLCVPLNLLQDSETIRFIIDYTMPTNTAIFHERDGRMVDYYDVIAKYPSGVPSIQDGVNLLEFYNSKSRKKITDNQYLVVDKHGRYYPITELFFARVP